MPPADRHDSGVYSYEARHHAEPASPGCNFNGGRTHRIALLLLSWETVATRQDAGLGLAPAGSGLGIEQKPWSAAFASTSHAAGGSGCIELLLWNMGTSGSHTGASSGVFSFEARHHAEWASTGQHLELLLLITARGSLAGAPAGRHDSGIYSYEARPNRFDRAAPRAAPPEHRDDCNGNVIGSAVLAGAGDQTARAAASTCSSGARLSAGAQGCP